MKTLLLLLLLPLAAFSQSAERWNTALIPKGSGSNFVSVIPNAKVSVCVYNSQLACNTSQPIYTDPTLTSTLTQPITAAANGVYSYYIQAGTRVVEKVCAPYNQCSFYEVYVGSSGGGSGGGCSINSPNDCVITDPTGNQTIIQPLNTSFVIQSPNGAELEFDSGSGTSASGGLTLNAGGVGGFLDLNIGSSGMDVNIGNNGSYNLNVGGTGSVDINSGSNGISVNASGGGIYISNGDLSEIDISTLDSIGLKGDNGVYVSGDSSFGGPPIYSGGLTWLSGLTNIPAPYSGNPGVAIAAPIGMNSSYGMIWPGAQGTGALTNDGSGNLSWTTGGTMTWPAAAGIPCYSGSSTWCTSYSNTNTIPANYIPTLNQNTTGYAASLAGGALGSVPYQSAANTTLFVSGPTTSGHAFFLGAEPSGSVIAPQFYDLGNYLGANVAAASPIVVTPSTLGVSISCPTCGTAGGGTSTAVNGGSTLGSLNINATSPVADASYLALLPKISGANMIIEAPYGTSSGFGVLECGSGTTCTSGVISVTGSGFPITIGSTSIASGSTTTAITGLTIDGVTPTIMGYVDATSSIQTQLNGKQASLGYTPAHSGANSDITSLAGLSTPLSAPQGGLGAASLTGYLYGNGSSAATASTTIPGSAVSGNISGNAANLSGTPTLPNGTSVTTQAVNNNSAEIASTAYVKSPGNITPTGITLTGTGPTTVGMPPTTFSVLSSAYPCASNVGRLATVSDSTTQTWGAAYTGGGALFASVVCDGSSYTVWGK